MLHVFVGFVRVRVSQVLLIVVARHMEVESACGKAGSIILITILTNERDKLIIH